MDRPTREMAGSAVAPCMPSSPHGLRRPSCRGMVAPARLSRQPCAGEPHRACHRARHQPAGRHRLKTPAATSWWPAGDRQRRADHSRARASGPVLPAAAGTEWPVRAHLRQGIFGARLPAGGAGTGALFDAAGPAQHRDRPQRGRCPPERGRPRGRRAALAAAARYRAAAGTPGDHGRHPHVRSLGDRHGDTRNTDRPDQSRQLHFHRFADAELGFRDFRLRRGRPARFGGRSVACAGAGRRHPPQQCTDGYRALRALLR